MNYEDIEDLDTLRELASNPETDPQLLSKIYGRNRPSADIVKLVLENPSCPSDLLNGFVENFRDLAKYEKFPTEFLRMALKHPNCPPAVVGRCLEQVCMDALGFLDTAKQAFLVMSACYFALRQGDETPFKQSKLNDLEGELQDIDLTLEHIQNRIAEMR
jgi:hypothetical protein